MKNQIAYTETNVLSFIGNINEVLDNHEITSMFINQNIDKRKKENKEILEKSINL